MSALNSLPLPVVRLLAFFHEELSERRPGRVPQTVQLWVGCLLVILISMTFEIPFVALSLAVLFYGIQSNAFYTKFVAILFVVATVLEIGSLFLIYKWSYGEPLIRLIIAGPILMGCMFLMRPIGWDWSFSLSPLSPFTGKPSPPCSTIRKWSCA